LVWGDSDPLGTTGHGSDICYPIDHPVSPGDVVATIYQLLGIDPHMTVPDLDSKPVSVAHGGEPIWDVIG
jgi:hypothetical protein